MHDAEGSEGIGGITPVDLLVGGFPCQDLSVAGKRRGFDGERSVLAFEFLRIAESLRPRWLLMENVPGLLSSNGGRDLARLLDELGACGYGWAYRLLDARYFGVPQRRRRIFICARRADAHVDSGAAAELALRALWEGSGGDPTPGWPPRDGAAPGSGGSAESGGRIVGALSAQGYQRYTDQELIGQGQLVTHEDVPDVAGTITRRHHKVTNSTVDDGALISFYPTGGSQSGFAREDGVSPTLKRGSTIGAESGTAIAHVVVDTASTLQASARKGVDAEGAAGGHLIPIQNTVIGRADTSGPGGRGHGDADGPMFTLDRSGPHAIGGVFPLQDARDVEKHQNGTGIGEAGAPAYTLDRQQHPAVAHTLTSAGHDASEDGTGRGTPLVPEHMSVRRLTPVECERLMGWPDGWTAPEGVKASDSRRYAACGDGIVSWVAYWIGCRIQKIEAEVVA